MKTFIKRLAALASLIVVVAASGCASTTAYHFDPNAPKLAGDSLG